MESQKLLSECRRGGESLVHVSRFRVPPTLLYRDNQARAWIMVYQHLNNDSVNTPMDLCRAYLEYFCPFIMLYIQEIVGYSQRKMARKSDKSESCEQYHVKSMIGRH